jgi:hypothetical protein
MLGRALVMTFFGVALTGSACGTVVTSNLPSPSPVTADAVRAAVDKSTMTSAHFVVTGRFQVGIDHDPVSGDGVVQRVPTEAFALNLTIQAAGRKLAFQEVTIGGRDYTRAGTAKWTSKPSSSNVSPTAPTVYVGEEYMSGSWTWHARSTDSSTTYDVWVRESDGYLVLLTLNQPSYFVSMSFDSYNKSPVIKAP